jgi:transposase
MSYTPGWRWNMRPLGSPETLQRRRERALVLLSKGYQPVDVARMLGVDRRSVRRWKSAYRSKGERGITAKPSPGRPCRLSAKDKRTLERALL